jgi:uncharacterized membrane protein
MKNNSLKFLIPILITSFMGLITFIYLSGRAESKESITEVKEDAIMANKKADDAMNKITQLDGKVDTLDAKVGGKIDNINTNIEWIKDAMVDNGIKPRK